MDGLSGIASGVDTSALVDKLMELERRPRERLVLRQAQINTRGADLREIQSKLLALRSAAAALRDVGTWADRQTVESSDPGRVTVERVSGAGPGGYSIEVLALARAEQRTYAYTKPAEATTIEVGGVSIALAANASIDDAVSAINTKAGSPVYAANVNGSLVLSARTTGTGSTFTATSSALLEDLSKEKPGVNAGYRIDGGPAVPSQTNVVADAIPGLKLTLKGVTTAPAAVTVGAPALDAAAVKEKVKAFVTAYNDLLTTTRGHLDEKRVAGARTTVDAGRGALYGDTGLSGLLAKLRVSVSDEVAGNPLALDELREIGISTGRVSASGTTDDAKLGKLVLDEEALTRALTENPLGVRRLLGGITGTDGFAQRVEGLVKGYTGADGMISARLKEGDTALKRIQDQMVREDARLAAKEARWKAQFQAMESALGAAQTQQAWLAGQLAQFQ